METRNRQERNGTMRELTPAESAAVIGGADDIVPVLQSRIAEER
jgi:hypothetical protein